MQRVFGVRYTGDARFVLSVSDDANVRVWKARASESLRRALPREREAADYARALKARYADVPDVRRVLKSRHLPKSVARARADEVDAAGRARVKAANVRAHARPGSKDGQPAGVRAAAVDREVK